MGGALGGSGMTGATVCNVTRNGCVFGGPRQNVRFGLIGNLANAASPGPASTIGGRKPIARAD